MTMYLRQVRESGKDDGDPFGYDGLSLALHEKSDSLCNLCVLCISVVVVSNDSLTTEAQRTQRLHREEANQWFEHVAVAASPPDVEIPS